MKVNSAIFILLIGKNDFKLLNPFTNYGIIYFTHK